MSAVTILLALTGFLVIVSAVLGAYVLRLRKQTSLVDDLPDPVLTVDRSGRISQANQRARLILGRDEKGVNGQSIIDLLPLVEPLLLDEPKEEAERIEIALGQGEEAKTYDVKVTVCQNQKGENSGWVVALHDITQPKQVGDELRRQKQQYERLLTVARATTEQPTVEETLQNALDVTAALTAAEYGSLLLLDENGMVTQGILALGKMVPSQEDLVRQILEYGLAGWVMKHREAALIDDTLDDERWLQSSTNGYQARSALAVPILNQQNVLAILTLTHSLPYHFQTEDCFLIETAAEQMALAVRNAQLYDEQRALAGRQTTLYEVLRTVGGHLDPDQVIDKASEIITQLTGWPALAILTPDETDSTLTVKAATGFLVDWVGHHVSADSDFTGKAYRLGKYQFRNQIEERDKQDDWPPVNASQLVVPMRRGDNVLGVLEVQSKTPYVITGQEVELAASLAEATALALDNARYHGAMRKHAADLNALYAVNRMIGRSLELDEMLSKSLYSALTSLGFGFGFISLINPATDRMQLTSQRSVPVELLNQYTDDSLGNLFAGYVFEQNRSIVIENLGKESGELARLRDYQPDFVEILRQLDVSSLVGVPLDHQRRSLGVMCMFSRKVHQFTANDVALQVTIGQQIGMAVSHSRLYSAVAEERSMLQALIDSSNDGIVMVAPNGRILVANHTALNFLQIEGSPDDWIDEPIISALMVLRRKTPKLVRDILEEIRQNAESATRSSDGEFMISSRSVRWQNLPVWSGNTFLGRLLVFHDMTDERELNKVREDLVHTMVHDLRNPLTNIFGSLEFLGEEVGPKLSSDYQQVLEIARTNAMHMVSMVAAILELNRLESGQLPLDQKPISLPTLIGNVARTQSPSAKNKNIELKIDAPKDLPLAWADGKLFERVLQNLLDNAMRFTPENGRIQITAGLENPKSDWLIVSVKDNGPGIPEDVQDRIFQKFTTARHQQSGTGLGLAFCKMVVESHGGRIWTENNPDVGASFHFTLPPLPAPDKQ